MAIAESIEIEIRTYFVKPNPKRRWYNKLWQPKDIRYVANDPSESLNKNLWNNAYDLEEALGVLSFYANREHWEKGASIDPRDTYTCEAGILRGGKLAREFLGLKTEGEG